MRKAVRYAFAGGEPRLGRLDGEVVIDAAPSPPGGFDAGPRAWQLIEEARGEERALADVRLLAPVLPPAVSCVGLNYRDHIEETASPLPEYPIIFAKLGSAIIGPGDPIVVPFDEPQTDYEAELALVIGSETRRAVGARARRAIGGVTAFNDVSGRHAQLTVGGGQYTRGKSFDTFGPIGPVVVHADDLDIDALGIRLVLSGVTKQESSTRHLVFGPGELVEWLSAASTLQPGDVIATGTPGGVGLAEDPPRFLVAGDEVEVHIDGIGVLRNPVVAEPLPAEARP
jgi:2-keto-4-pentenoate hydratase/2-oxohepta-3-ene-1,7-dioic acid hydratase in catechol pathway